MFRSGDKNIEYKPNEVIYTELIDQSGNIGKIVIDLTTTGSNAHLSVWDAKNFRWYNIYEVHDLIATYPPTGQKIEWQYFAKDRTKMIRIFRFLFKYTAINTSNNDEPVKDEEIIDAPTPDIPSEINAPDQEKLLEFIELKEGDIIKSENNIFIIKGKTVEGCYAKEFKNIDDAIKNVDGHLHKWISPTNGKTYTWIGNIFTSSNPQTQSEEPPLSQEDEDLINMI